VVAVVEGGGAYFGHHRALDLVVALQDGVIEIEARYVGEELSRVTGGVLLTASTSALGQHLYSLIFGGG